MEILGNLYIVVGILIGLCVLGFVIGFGLLGGKFFEFVVC